MFRKLKTVCVGVIIAGWLSPLHPHARLSAPVDCIAQPGTGLHLERGTEIELVDWVRPPPHGSYYVVNILSGPNRGWRCEIDGTGHAPLTIDEKKRD